MPLEIVRDDITRMNVDAIVNAANTSLLGGGGVDGAIHAAAGPELLEECRRLGGCPTGQAKITKGYRLPARYIIHTPGPVWMGGSRGERQLLASCYRSSLRLAEEYGCESIAFPMISTGVYGYPKDEALHIALDEITAFLLEHEMTVYIVTFGKEMFETTGKLFSSVRAYIDDAGVEASERKFSRNRSIRWAEKAQSGIRDIMPEETWAAPQTIQENTDDDLTSEAAPLPNLADAMTEVSEKPPASGLRQLFRRQNREIAAPLPAAEIAAPSQAGPGGPAKPQDDIRKYREQTAAEPLFPVTPKAISAQALVDYLKAQDIGFSEALIRLIDEKGMTDVQCYKQANIDRKLFNHIKNKKDYKPAKKTALAFAVALHLNPSEAETLLNRAGYSLSPSSPMDLAIRFFLEKEFYNIHEINIMLYDLDLPLLGA